MDRFKVEFLHTDGDIREVFIEAFDAERARGRFECNWGLDMKILSLEISAKEN